jgi:hypothetical protein
MKPCALAGPQEAWRQRTYLEGAWPGKSWGRLVRWRSKAGPRAFPAGPPPFVFFHGAKLPCLVKAQGFAAVLRPVCVGCVWGGLRLALTLSLSPGAVFGRLRRYR